MRGCLTTASKKGGIAPHLTEPVTVKMGGHAMRNAHIAFVNFPHPPHVNPTLPVVSVMVRRGYRVTYATSDRFASQIASLGAEVVHSSPFITPFSRTEANETLDDQGVIGLADRMLAEITPFYENNRPDLVIYDFMALAGRILARRGRIRAIQTCPTFARDKSHKSKLFEEITDADARREMLEYFGKVDQFLEQHGIVDGFLPFHEKLNIHFFPRSFQPPGNVFGTDFFYAGRCAGEQAPYGDWRRDDADERPIVLIGTSTTYTQGSDYFQMCIEALRDLNCHIIVYAGDKFDAATLLALPAHCEVVRHTAQVKLFRHARLLICHGGIITPAEAAYYGVPLLMTTHGFCELEMQADIFASLGLGIHLRKSDTNVENIGRSAKLLMTDTSVLNKIKQIQYRVLREPGSEETVNRIEEYLEA